MHTYLRFLKQALFAVLQVCIYLVRASFNSALDPKRNTEAFCRYLLAAYLANGRRVSLVGLYRDLVDIVKNHRQL